MTALLLVSVGPKLVAGLALPALGALWAGNGRATPAWRRAAALAGAAAAAALLARLLLVAPTHRVFYDEYEHLDLARNLAERGVYAATMGFVPGALTVDRLPLWPPLAHLHYAALFLVRGYSEGAVYALNVALSCLVPLAAAAASFTAFANPAAAGLTALFLALSPVAVSYASTADLSSVALLWTALAWLAVLRAEKRDGRRDLWAAGLTVAAALHARPDGLLLLPPLLWLLARRGRAAAGPAAMALASGLPLLVLAWSARAAGHDGYGDSWGSLSGRAPLQALENLWFFLEPSSPRPLLLAAAAWGFWSLRRERVARALALSAGLYFALYAAYPTSAFGRGSGDKYALAVELPLALLAGLGAARLLEKRPRALLAGVAAAGVLAPLSLRPHSDPGYAASDAFLRRLAPHLAGAPPLLTFVPPAGRAVLDAAVVHPRLLLEKGPAALDPAGRGFLLLRDEAGERRPADAAALDALVKALYAERELYAEEAAGRRRALTRLTPR
ncbi:MAG: hypothetical protein SF051_10290 [Elusimicrobiota bacterium]|nr:hypothetical protein [Elusimicrobiota bacterium]